VSGFKKSCIFTTMDKANDDMLCNDSDDNGNVRSVEDDSTDCEDGDSDTDWYM